MLGDNGELSKPLLTVGQQIAHMKAKGIVFDLCSEEKAAAHLNDKCQFFRIYAYRKSFQKRIGGKRNGQYIDLDFEHLRKLSCLDRMLRDALLPMTLDVEHFAKVRLLSAAVAHGEDGYAVMRDYFASVSDGQRIYIEHEFSRREDDPYEGDVVRKYRGNMPLWVFCEIVSFGAFLGVLRFCAERWGDDELLKAHYCLRLVKSIRNACAHSACVLNDLSDKRSHGWRAPVVVTKTLAECGIGKRLRSKWLASPRLAQICTLLCLYNWIVPQGVVRLERERALGALLDCFRETDSIIPGENPTRSAFAFMERLIYGLGLVQ